MKTYKILFTSLLIMLFSNLTTYGQSPTERAAVDKHIHGMVDAWNAKDAASFANYFSDDCALTVWNGIRMLHLDKKTNQQIHQGLFDQAGPEHGIQVEIEEVTFPAPTLAMAYLNASESEGKMRVSALLNKNGKGWEIISFQMTGIQPTPEQTGAGK